MGTNAHDPERVRVPKLQDGWRDGGNAGESLRFSRVAWAGARKLTERPNMSGSSLCGWDSAMTHTGSKRDVH